MVFDVADQLSVTSFAHPLTSTGYDIIKLFTHSIGEK